MKNQDKTENQALAEVKYLEKAKYTIPTTTFFMTVHFSSAISSHLLHTSVCII